MAGKVVDLDKGWKEIRKAVKAATQAGSYVKVGVLGQSESAPGESLTNAELAAVQEFGTLDGHIPARPFIGGTYDVNRDKYMSQIKRDLGKVLAGKMTIETVLKRAGLRYSSDVKSTVMGGQYQFQRNAPSTIAKKGSDVPLIDTNRMVASVTYEVVLGGGKSVGSSGPGKS